MDTPIVNQTAEVRKQSPPIYPSRLIPNAGSRDSQTNPGVQSFTRTHRTSDDCCTYGYVYYGERIQVKSSQGKKHIVQNGGRELREGTVSKTELLLFPPYACGVMTHYSPDINMWQ